jgi:hypothetical protein
LLVVAAAVVDRLLVAAGLADIYMLKMLIFQ